MNKSASFERRVVLAIQARMASRRLPGKVLAPIANKPLLALLIERLQTKFHDDIIVMTTTCPEDDDVIACARQFGVNTYRGPEDDVLTRYIEALETERFDSVVRITADNPMTDPVIIEDLISHLKSGPYDYVHCANTPLGCGADIFKKQTLIDCHQNTQDPYHREHINGYILDHRQDFRIGVWQPSQELCRPDIEVTVDTPGQLAYVRSLTTNLANPVTAGLKEIVDAADFISSNG